MWHLARSLLLHQIDPLNFLEFSTFTLEYFQWSRFFNSEPLQLEKLKLTSLLRWHSAAQARLIDNLQHVR